MNPHSNPDIQISPSHSNSSRGSRSSHHSSGSGSHRTAAHIVESQSEYYNSAYPPTSNGEDFSFSSRPSISRPTTPLPAMSYTEIQRMLQTLRQHRVNTLTELRRIERSLLSLEAFMSDYYLPMSEAWTHYVSSNNFLNELRGLTRQYPFSTELLEEAKRRVHNDAAESRRSWCWPWLLLQCIKKHDLVKDFANRTAHQPAMWGGVVPEPGHALELSKVLAADWNRAVDRLLRHWQTPPTVDEAW